MVRILYTLLTCILIIPAFAQLPQLQMVQVGTGFSAPLDIRNCGDERIFVVEQGGYIRIMDKQGNKQSTPFLDIHTKVLYSGERGLLSMAFSPNYKQDGFFYVNYCSGSGSGTTVISRFKVSSVDSNLADAASEKVLLTFAQPYNNHKGATLSFGADGYLYDSQGDGGSGGDPQNYGQNQNSLLGKILRLDVSNPDTTYLIPPTNPYYGDAGKKAEIWAYGLRNPFRCSFDRITHDYWIADVGQSNYEEINFQPASSAGGENYGWRCYEGLHAYGSCTPPSVFPVFEYTHSFGCSVTGGYVYRGTQHSKLWGLYLFTDYCTGRFWTLKQTSPGVFDPDTLQTFLTNQYSGFGEDNNGELYLAAISQGRIYRITETSSCNPVAFISMSDTIKACKPVTLQALKGDNLLYQWYNTSGEINGAVSSDYTAMQAGWYKVKVAKTQVGCEAVSDSVYVTADDSSALSFNTNLSYCNNETPVSLNTAATPAGGTFTGTAVANNTFTPALANTGLNTITYNYTNGFGCKSTATFAIEVKDSATLNRLVSDTPACINGGVINLAAFTEPLGGTYTGPGISNNEFTPLQADTGAHTILYTYTNSNGCVSHSSISILVFNDSTDLSTLVTDSSICINNGAIALNGFIIPAGGTYTGTGVSNAVFDPAASGPGSFVIQYNYGLAGCPSKGAVNIQVQDTSLLTANTPSVTYCTSELPFALAGIVLPAGGVFSGNGVSNDTFSPATAGVGFTDIYYTYTNDQGCVSTTVFPLSVAVCTGIEDEDARNTGFNIYPNPGRGRFYLTVNTIATEQLFTLTVTNALGQVCHKTIIKASPTNRMATIDAPQLAKGMYVLKLEGNYETGTKRLLVE